MADSIKCPECKAEIPLTEVISHQIEEELAAKLARELAAREKEFESREKALIDAAAEREQALKEATAEREKELREAAAAQEAQLRQTFEDAQTARETELAKRAEEKVAATLADLGSRVEEQDALLRAAQKRELDLLQQKRKLDEEKQKLDLGACPSPRRGAAEDRVRNAKGGPQTN